ncbi:amino acid transporter heavy chain SLC3A2-like [Passer domesticus]|uniref:amino acid transporter heavy chain SLC3A2-like n=1 Tax=Passer domesticus TaxID=48849 RepID=UPI0030FED63D
MGFCPNFTSFCPNFAGFYPNFPGFCPNFPVFCRSCRRLPWEIIEEPKKGGNGSEPPELELCTALASLRAHERSLLLGEARAVPAGAAIALLRRWDQSQRFLLLLNPHGDALRPFSGSADPRDPPLPAAATLRFSTGPGQRGEQQLQLQQLSLEPRQGLLLGFPYSPE